MKRKKLICSALLSVTLMVGGVCASTVAMPSVVVRAEQGIGDNLGGNSSSSGYNTTVNDDTGVSDFFKNHRPMTSEQLNQASYTVTPITNIFGYLIGAIIALTSTGIFLITALDLLYISIPPVRGMLYSGGGGAQGNGGKSSQWVSDEAVQCSALLGGGSSGGMSGGYAMGSMGQQYQQGGTKSIIMAYLKKRIFFVILFAVCTVILTSSILLGTGVNLAQWGMKLIEILNNSIPAL